MLKKRLPWREELDIIDRTMKAISSVTDPEKLVDIYWEGIGDLVSINDFVALSRRNVEPPEFLITRSSRFTEHFNPWTEREKLPRLSGGLLGELLYNGRPEVIEDLPSRIAADDPGRFYLEGFQSLIASPNYDNGEALNMTVLLLPPGEELDFSVIPSMHWQGSLFGRGTQNLVLRNQLAEALKALDRELQVVGSIQRALLPPKLPSIPGFDLAAHYQTSAQAGGDYYDFFPLADGCWGIFIGDVSGHGAPAAVIMAITHATAHAQPGTHTPPGALLQSLNDQLSQAYIRDESFVTAFYAVLDPRARTLRYARAGHNPPRLVRGHSVQSLDATGSLPLGVLPGQVYDDALVSLERGDVLLLYTDGITEAMMPLGGESGGALFGLERLDALLVDCATCSADECLSRVRKVVAEFSNNAPLTDDQTLVALRCE